MKKRVFAATHNEGKIERYRKLIGQGGLDIEIISPADLGLPDPETEETGLTLAENAEIKARAFFGRIDVPILSNDTGFWVEGEGLVDTPKRTALGTRDEKSLGREETAKYMLDFWKGIARKYGGQVDAAWIEAFCVLEPDGKIKIAESRRDVILTDTEFGTPHPQMPIRALYISKATGKPALHETEEEHALEMVPVIEALRKVLS